MISSTPRNHQGPGAFGGVKRTVQEAKPVVNSASHAKLGNAPGAPLQQVSCSSPEPTHSSSDSSRPRPFAVSPRFPLIQTTELPSQMRTCGKTHAFQHIHPLGWGVMLLFSLSPTLALEPSLVFQRPRIRRSRQEWKTLLFWAAAQPELSKFRKAVMWLPWLGHSVSLVFLFGRASSPFRGPHCLIESVTIRNSRQVPRNMCLLGRACTERGAGEGVEVFRTELGRGKKKQEL